MLSQASTIVSAALLALTLGVPASAQAPGAPRAKGPLVLKEQGTFFVGGKIERRSPNTSVPGDAKFAVGDIAVNAMYVEYQIPETLKYKYPIVMLHGGGHSGQVYRTTPDGREGWFTSFTRRGFVVYVVDAPNRGRSGWDPTNRYLVSTGQKPPAVMEPSNIYSAQSAWTSFRWGPDDHTQYPGQQFPMEHLNDYLGQLVPSYRDNIQNDYIAQDLEALVDKIGPCILLGWSTGAGNVMVTGTGRLDTVKGIIAIEGTPPDPARSKVEDSKLAKVPFLVLIGDNISPDDAKAFAARITKVGGDATVVVLPEIGIKGNGHTMMLERNNEDIADRIEQWVAEHAAK
jgi:pimeloyl-ACP methyl ester carboxylesterase